MFAYSFVIAVAQSADVSADPHQELVNRILQVTVFLFLSQKVY